MSRPTAGTSGTSPAGGEPQGLPRTPEATGRASFWRRPDRKHARRRLGAAGVGVVALSLTMAPSLIQHAAAASWWQPGQITSWAYIIGEVAPLSIPPVVGGVPTDVQVVDADLGDTGGLTSGGAPVVDAAIEASIAAVHAYGGKALCYMEVGSAENYRSDYSEFAPQDSGRHDVGLPR